jgi:hypothetical protein
VLNRESLDILIHPLTDDMVDDHTAYALWLRAWRRVFGRSSEGVTESQIFNLYASQAKAGAHGYRGTADPRWQSIAIALEVPSGGGMGPGFRRETEGKIC